MGTESPTPEAVKAARIAAGLTQEQAGAAVGVARRTWQDWERGQRRMPPGLFELFAIKRTAA
jgi:DNA-binding XRE family transcriptional regulator